MTKQCLFLNPLQRDGTSQNQRLLEALLPSSALIDERSLADMLVYAQKYAKLLRYYTDTNTPMGDWQEFVKHDVSVSVAMLGVSDFQQQKKCFDDKRTLVKASSDLTAFAGLFHSVFALLQQIDNWYQNSRQGLALHTSLQRLINSVLKEAVHDLLAHALTAKNVGLAVEIPDFSGFSTIWGELSEILPATDTLSSPPTSDELEIGLRTINRHFEVFYKALVFSVEHADDYLQETLQNYPEHQPHMALLLAFLQLFKYAQNDLNTLSTKHLHFYYEDILQLQRKSEQPDQVHLIFELAKQLDQHRLEKNIDFKAGKDIKGSNLFYANDDEMLINQARLSEEYGLMTVFVDKTVFADKSEHITGIHAASYANSSDGLGAAITDEEGKWNTFGSNTMPQAAIGFALASPMLLLAEGTRKIVIRFNLESLQPLLDSGNNIDDIAQQIKTGVKVFLSGEKQWLSFSLESVTIKDEGSSVSDDSEPAELLPKPPGGVHPPWSPGDGAFPWSPVDDHLLMLPDIIGLKKQYRLASPSASISDVAIVESLPHHLEAEEKVRQAYIEFHLILKPEDEAVVAYNDTILLDGFVSSHPVAKFILSPGGESDDANKAYVYDYLNNIVLQSLDISVDVSGVRNLILENDLGVLNPAKPFYPFGPVPKKGSKFYIGSNEVFQKYLNSVSVDVTWGDLPEENFEDYYLEYKSNNFEVENNCHFKAILSQLHNGKWESETRIDANEKTDRQKKKLFNSTSNGIDNKRTFFYKKSTIRPSAITPFNRFHVGLQYGFMRMELMTSFLHNLYPSVLAAAVKPAPANDIPNIPYTPVITDLKLKYKATESIDYTQLKTDDVSDRITQLFHITPFGQLEIFPASGVAVTQEQSRRNHSLMADFPVSDKNNETAEGTLYIGIDKLKPPQNLSILFQAAESSADPEVEIPEVSWSYMENNRWVKFTDAGILADKTNGLLTSGIIRFAIPERITDNNTLLPKGLHWLKASVENNSRGITKLIAVKPQAVAVSFRNQKNDLSHLASALPAETISKLKQRDTAIKKISQPFASSGGQLPERDEAFYTRVSERLRHKGRAITIFDYERLVLEQFPAIYKVKCINHTQQGNEFSPGHVRLIVVPDLRNKNAIDPLRPRTTVNTLKEIGRYISRLSSDFVTIEVDNPQYEEIRVSFNVAFHKGYDKGFYLNQLEQEIIRFLSPWLYDDVADISFGGRIHRTWILNHVEEQEYVDFVTDFRMDHLLDSSLKSDLKPELESGAGSSRLDVEQAVVQSSSTVLVSSKTHNIKLAEPLLCEKKQFGDHSEQDK